jgi:hypothetical protein
MTDSTAPATPPTPAVPERPMLRGDRVWLRPTHHRPLDPDHPVETPWLRHALERLLSEARELDP